MSGKRKWKIALAAVAFLGITVAFFLMSQSLLTTPMIWVHAPHDVERIDFSTDIAYLHNDAYDWYGGKLYTPDDFASGVPEPEASNARYGTNRLILRLPVGKIYSISGPSASYAQKVWINGALLSEVGRVTDTPEGFIPKTMLYNISFLADRPETEIVIQRAHFNHVRGYYVKVYLGEAPLIAQMDKGLFMREGLITGALVAIAIFFFGMFFFYPSRFGFLWFALACFATALQNAIYSKSIMIIFSNLNWYLGHKMEYIALIAYFFFMFLYAFSTMEWKINKWLRWSGYVFFIGSMAVYAILPSTLYTHYTKTMRELLTAYVSIGAISLLVTAIRHKELRKPEHLLVVVSMLMMATAWWIEQRGYMGDMVIAVPLATLLCAFLGSISLIVGFSRTEQQLDLANQREREITETNAMLQRMNTLKNDFLQNIAHEMTTPLTVMSGYAQRAQKEINAGTANEGTRQGLLTISLEAQRLAMLAQQLLSAPMETAGAEPPGPIHPHRILERVAALCEPILEKNHNQLQINIGAEVPEVRANENMIIQALVNLCVNASQHTKDGMITVGVKKAEKMVVFTVEDNGEGIVPELLPHVFERGVGKGGGNGLGLAICKDVVEYHGGEITIESKPGSGTLVTFTLPFAKESEDAPT